GGMYALDSAHAALALGSPVVVVARMSSGDERDRHRGLSHHTRTVLELLLAAATVALPAGMDLESPDLERPAADRPAELARHDWRARRVDLAGFAASGLAGETMRRGVREDELFFAAALAGGAVLAEQAGAGEDAIARR